MATNKTITPTNVTVSIPAMTGEKPDMSVITNCIDKSIDGINNLQTNKADHAATSWGTSITWTATGSMSLLTINYEVLVVVWTPSTTQVSILVIAEAGNYRKTGTTSLTFGTTASAETYTIERSGNSITVTAGSNASFEVFT